MIDKTESKMISKEEIVTSEDLELLHRLRSRLLPASAGDESPQLLRDINKIILEYDERQLRFVYFFVKGIS